MVLFPILEPPSQPREVVSAWKAVEECQTQRAPAYWLVTQPAHAALAGELAAALRQEIFGVIDPLVARAIALHDSGWSLDDAEQIRRLRANDKAKPASFIDSPVPSFLRAWTGSIETTEKFAPVGGYLVSRHFERLSRRDDQQNQSAFEAFRRREQQRQQRLQAKIGIHGDQLERLVDALQFCDLLSLYLCCGSLREVRFEQPGLRIIRHGEEYRLDPSPFRKQRQFSFSALRHPRDSRKDGPSRSGATFYINL